MWYCLTQQNSFVEFAFHICLDVQSIDSLPITNHINTCQRKNETTYLIFLLHFPYE